MRRAKKIGHGFARINPDVKKFLIAENAEKSSTTEGTEKENQLCG